MWWLAYGAQANSHHSYQGPATSSDDFTANFGKDSFTLAVDQRQPVGLHPYMY
jgi:hypothetical protein